MTAIKPGSTVTIYAIRCKRNGYRYVGATGTSVRRRWSNHKSKLRGRQNHGTVKLQEAWDRFGEGSFVVEVLEEGVSYSDAAEREAFWIGQFRRIFNTGDPLDLGTHAEKDYIVTPPGGPERAVRNLRRYCQENRLGSANMVLVAQGVAVHHRGWLCRYAGDAAPKVKRERYTGGYWVDWVGGGREFVSSLKGWCRTQGFDPDTIRRLVDDLPVRKDFEFTIEVARPRLRKEVQRGS